MRRAVLLIALVACHRNKPPRPLPPLPHAAYAHYLDGKLSAYRDDWSGAAAALDDASRAAPDQPMVAVELARAQQRAKQDAAARRTLADARVRWPKHAQVWLASGDLLSTTAPLEAIRAYRRAIELEPTDERPYLGLAKLEQPPNALATLRRLVKRVPTSIEGHYRLGVRLATARQLEPAIKELRKVLELDPDHIDARIDLARALRRQGHLADAIAQTRSAFDRSGQAIDLAEELFYLLLEADDRTAALDLLTLLDDDRSDPDALATVARLHRGMGRLDDARAIGTRIAKQDGELGALVLADVDLAAGDHAAAVKRTLAIPEKSDRFTDARKFAAAALLAAGDPKRAGEVLAPARTAKPDDVDLATAAAFALADQGKLADARALLDKLGTGAAQTYAKARLADHAGDVTTALALVEGLVREKPDLVAALNLAGFLLADANQRLADAERYLRHARELSPGDPAILDSWGWLLYRKGEYRAAVRALDRASRFAPREPEILYHLAAAWAADGAPRTGLATLDSAATLHPPAHIQRRIETLRARLAGR
ncbi:MAG TPA: tetratricopeptide repeat protein [Kofleriaceae bacterium]|nr:tetratricopeptide repeat protein [Kofleriaceae bacterium]